MHKAGFVMLNRIPKETAGDVISLNYRRRADAFSITITEPRTMIEQTLDTEMFNPFKSY
jgi:hypothetical protein